MNCINHTVRHPVLILSEIYPQLYLPVYKGASTSELYQKIVSSGYAYQSDATCFSLSDEDELIYIDTPYGRLTCIYLSCRDDFENFIRIMRYECEPVMIPASIGAMFITGINNQRKLEGHQKEYIKERNRDAYNAFQYFIAKKKNCTDKIIVLSKGGYSGVDYKRTKYPLSRWYEISKKIRIYHEYTHFIYRNLFMEKRDIIREEIICDAMGLLYAISEYDTSLAKMFLGVEHEKYTWGGRLESYIEKGSDIEAAASKAKRIIAEVSERLADINSGELCHVDIIKYLNCS